MQPEQLADMRHYLTSCRSSDDHFIEPDVVLVQAPCWSIVTPPFGIATLTGYLRSRGFKVLPLDLNVECYLKRDEKYENAWSIAGSFWLWNTPAQARVYSEDNRDMLDRFADIIVATNTRVVGFTTQSSSVMLSLGLARRIKERNPDIIIVFGGPQAARYLQPRDILETGYCDLTAHGEGELTLEELLLRVRAGEELTGCPGTVSLVAGELVEGEARPTIKNLDELPYPDLSDFDFNSYFDSDTLPMATSRGCVNNCAFCAEVAFWPTYRGLSGERLFAEARAQVERYPGIKEIAFQDSLINGRLKELERFGQLVKASDLQLHWSGQAIMRKDLTFERLTELVAAGCRHMTFGMESGSVEVLVNIGKKLMKRTDADRIARDAHRAGLTCTYNFMFGLPGESEQEFQETLDFVRRNKEYLYRVSPSEAFCCFTPGTDGYEHPERFGIRDVESIYYWESLDGSNTFLVRLRRFEDFCNLVADLGVNTTYPWRQVHDRERLIANFHHYKEDWVTAAHWYQLALERSSDDVEAKQRLAHCHAQLARSASSVASIVDARAEQSAPTT